ncbi:MAG: hypothetical protein JO323_04820 [Acidobacteriia bacterium]|nr:hypothetical protein [Terriglobia bacterium]
MINTDRRNIVPALRVTKTCGTRHGAERRKPFEVPDDMLAAVRDDVMLRRAERGLEWFGNQRSVILAANPENRNTAALAGYLSQWIDAGADRETLRELVGGFQPHVRAQLSLNGYVQLRLAEGMLSLADGNVNAASAHFDFIISVEQEPVLDNEVATLAHFWKAICQRERGELDDAMEEASRGRGIATALGYVPAAAMIQALEGCLNIQKGRLVRGAEQLRDAQEALSGTGDFISLGNIHSGYGSAALEEGRYEMALDHFASAINDYQRGNPRYTGNARALVDLAHTQRLITLGIARSIDAGAERRRGSAATSRAGLKLEASATRQRVERLRDEAFSNLARASDIYTSCRNGHGLALARLERGFLLLDCGDFDRAAIEANETFDAAARKRDYAIMARSRLVHSKIETAQYEEGIGDTPAAHAQRAYDFARDALTYAKQTEDRRLLARVYTCQGLIYCCDFFNNGEAARECRQYAGELLIPGNRNELWDDYQALAAKVLRTGAVDSKLQKWTQGIAEEKSFQQMTEEFADLVIPSIWEHEERNVSRVVARLSISPKKVRRVLGRVGVKAGRDRGE